MSVDHGALRALLGRAFLPALPGAPELRDVTVQPFHGRGWYDAYTVAVHLDDGARYKLFLKDFGAPRADKGDMAARRERERCLYARLLRPDDDGTARFYGADWDDGLGRYWLLLEYVEGTPVRQLDLQTWCRAAAWLARFQAASRARSDPAASCRLVLHDEGFFLDVAAGAVRAVSLWSAAEGARLRELLGGYGRWLDHLLDQPPTLVHGAYLPVQILAAGNAGDRLCPLDWELAGLGPAVYDLGFLAYGFSGEERHALLAAYRDEAARVGLAVPDDLSGRVACVEVHRTLAALGHSVERGYSDQAIGEYMAILEALMDRAEAGKAF